MNEKRLTELLQAVAEGTTRPEQAVELLRELPFEDLGFAKLDHHRALRKGYPETIFCQGKTSDQVVQIVGRMREHGTNVLATRCARETADAVLAAYPEAVHHEVARAVTLTTEPVEPLEGKVAVLCAGTSDMPVAEEAVVTLESLGISIKRIYDVGVAGIHRLLGRREDMSDALVIIVCAGVEGALASAVGGLVDKPVIAVPTSIGYGASFGGIAALLGMLNSCASGVSVVNIDNGFGAAMYAGTIVRMVNRKALS